MDSVQCETNLVVAIADVTTFVPLVRAAVNKTLGIVDVAITSSTARAPWIGRIGHVEVDETAAAGEITSHSDGLVTAH